MRFYIAARWGRKELVRALAAPLAAAGHEWTHDWTQEIESEGWRERACADDTRGVLSADLVIMVLPARRGAHVELGIALAAGKRILICMDRPEDEIEDGYGCPFYYGPNTDRLAGSFHDWVREVLRVAHELECRHG